LPSQVSCDKMRASLLFTCALFALVTFLEFGDSTFTNTGALTLTIPALTGTTLTATQAAALGLGAAGLLGAAALGVAAGVAARNRNSGGNNRSRGQRRGRHGRDVSNEVVDGVDLVFKAIFEMDESDCAKRYLCEISATPSEKLTTQDINTLQLFQAPSSARGTFKSVFDEAAVLGGTTGNLQNCRRRYKKCTVKGEALADILNADTRL